MNFLISIVFTVCTFQIFVSTNEIYEAEYTLEDLQYDVETINQTFQNYKESIFMQLAANYELMEGTIITTYKNETSSEMIKLQNEHGIVDMETVEEPLKSCFANCSATWFKKCKRTIRNLRECAVNMEILNYMIPIESYDNYFLNTINNLEFGIKAEIFANYEKKNYSEILSQEHYMHLKSSELTILVDSLKSVSQNLIKLLNKAKENVLSETKHCSFKANEYLKKQWPLSQRKLNKCFSQFKNKNK